MLTLGSRKMDVLNVGNIDDSNVISRLVQHLRAAAGVEAMFGLRLFDGVGVRHVT